jgi:hypothetical protein
MSEAEEDDEGAAHRHRGVDVLLGEPHHRRVLELAELDELPALLDEDPAEAHHHQNAEDHGRLLERARETVHDQVETKVDAAPHTDRGAQKDDPDEQQPRDLVVPGEGAGEHVAREHAEEDVHAERNHHHEQETLDDVAERATNHRAGRVVTCRPRRSRSSAWS